MQKKSKPIEAFSVQFLRIQQSVWNSTIIVVESNSTDSSSVQFLQIQRSVWTISFFEFNNKLYLLLDSLFEFKHRLQIHLLLLLKVFIHNVFSHINFIRFYETEKRKFVLKKISHHYSYLVRNFFSDPLLLLRSNFSRRR